MKKYNQVTTLILSFLSCYASNLFAQESTQIKTSLRDSTKTLAEVIVLANKKTDFAAGSRIIDIDSKLIKVGANTNLTDILGTYAPAYIRMYGGGMLATASFRGTSANHTAVLWNGFNISLPTLGQSDFSILPILPNTNIQIQLGAASSNYGTSAVGATILLNSNLEKKIVQPILFQQDIGSFGLSKTVLQHYKSYKKITSQTSLYYTILENNFDFVNINKFGNPKEKQENAAVKQFGFTQDLLFQISPKSTLNLKAWYVDSYRQIQPAMGSRNDESKQADKNFRLMAEYGLKYSINSEKIAKQKVGDFKIRTAFFNDVLNYEAATISASAVQTWQTQIENTLSFSSNLTLQTGGDFQYFSAQVDGYGKETKIEKRSSLFALLRYQANSKLNITANFRQAFVEGFNPTPTPSLGLDYQVFNNNKNIVTIKTNFSLAYRVPTLNERFWRNGGNPNLKPESSYNGEISLQHELIVGKLNFYNNITYYNNLVDNWILWKQGTSFWYPENILQVNARGVEFATKLGYRIQSFSFLAGLQYQFTQSTQVAAILPEEKNKQLSYIPLHTSSIFGLIQYKKILLNMSTNYIGKRFTTTDNLNFLPAYLLTNLSIGYQHDFKALRKNQEKTSLNFYFRIYNLTNQIYQNVEGKAMPLRNYTLSLQFAF